MSSLNQCNFIGNLGKDADLRYSASGMPVSKFSIAVSSKSKGEETTEWVNVVLFDKTAEALSQYLVKGKSVFVSGRLQTRKWTDTEGATKYMTEIVAERVQLLGSKGEGQQQQPARKADPPTRRSDPDDLPFE